MSTHDDDTCPHLVRASLLESENARLKAEVLKLRERAELAEAYVEDLSFDCRRLKADVDRLQAQSDFYRSKLMDETAYKTNINLLDQVKHLEAEVARMASNERMKAIPVEAKLMDRLAELKAQVERLTEDNRQLTKAFEIAEGIIKRMGKAAEYTAKEGKPSV